MSTSRTEAHKIFGALYRKERPPELQEKVDEVISKTNDIFLRIDMIKKIDEDAAKNNRYGNDSDSDAQRKSARVGGGADSPRITRKEPVGETGIVSSIISNLFGINNELSKFAKETGALEVGLFGKVEISGAVEKVFKSLREDQVLSVIQALKVCEQQGYRFWDPLTYNIINNFNKFVNEFISLDSLFVDNISPDVFLSRSLKMQMYYARYLSQGNSREVIEDKVLEMIKKDQKLSGKQAVIMQGMNYLLNLEAGKPTLTDIIRSFYAISTKKLMTWDDVVARLKVPPVSDTQFVASQEVRKEVELNVAKITESIRSNLYQKEEIEKLKNSYFNIDSKGKITFDFLVPVVDDYISRHYSEVQQASGIKSTFKSMPHRLLYLILRDFQSNFLPILEGYVKIGSKNQSKDVLVVQSGLFAAEIEEMNNIFRNLDAFNRKYPSFQYTFGAFSEDMKGQPKDQIAGKLLQMLLEAAAFFGKFSVKIHTVVDNHHVALEYERSGEIQEKVLASKEKAIDEIKMTHRFIPFFGERLVTHTRVNELTVYQAFYEMAKLLINYAVLFKDKITIKKLATDRKLEADLQQEYEEYRRLTGTDYQSNHQEE